MNKQAEKLFNQGDKESAIKLIVADLNKNPKQLPEILQLSTYLVQAGDLEQAEELLARSLEMYKDNQDLLYNLGNVYYLADKFDKANDIFQNLVNDDYAFEAYFMLAKTLDQQGKRQLAIMYALTAVEKSAKDLQANELLADLLLANGNFQESLGFYKTANKIKPQAKYYFNMALCERLKLAGQILRHAAAKTPVAFLVTDHGNHQVISAQSAMFLQLSEQGGVEELLLFFATRAGVHPHDQQLVAARESQSGILNHHMVSFVFVNNLVAIALRHLKRMNNRAVCGIQQSGKFAFATTFNHIKYQ